MVLGEPTHDEIRLVNNVVLKVVPCSERSTRGLAALMSVAMLGRDNSDNDASSPSPMLPAAVFYDDQPVP